MKTGRIFWGVGCILLAVIFILDAVGIMSPFISAIGEISLIKAVAGLLLISLAISRLAKGKIGEIFPPLAITFMLFEKNIAVIIGSENPNLINNWVLFGCSLLLWIGFNILIPNLTFTKRHHGKNSHHIRSSLSSQVEYIDASILQREVITNHLGSVTVNFINPDQYKGDGILLIENHLGAVEINVPDGWNVKNTITNHLAATEISSRCQNTNGPTLHIMGENHLGAVEIRTV